MRFDDSRQQMHDRASSMGETNGRDGARRTAPQAGRWCVRSGLGPRRDAIARAEPLLLITTERAAASDVPPYPGAIYRHHIRICRLVSARRIVCASASARSRLVICRELSYRAQLAEQWPSESRQAAHATVRCPRRHRGQIRPCHGAQYASAHVPASRAVFAIGDVGLTSLTWPVGLTWPDVVGDVASPLCRHCHRPPPATDPRPLSLGGGRRLMGRRLTRQSAGPYLSAGVCLVVRSFLSKQRDVATFR